MDPYLTHCNNFKAYLLSAKKKFDDKWHKPIVQRGKLEDFKLLQTIGTGSFGRVMLVKTRSDNKIYALKMLEKTHLVETKQVKHTISEIRIMDGFDFPFLITLDFFFIDNVYICLVMPFINGGEMFTHLRQMNKFSEDLTRFYAAQVVLTFEYMHFLGIVYRDLKPENILIDHEGYLKVTDYGFCKKIDDQRTYTLCGTPEYLAPEIILSQGYNHSVDWWSLGVLIYEMAAGYPPFYSKDPMKIYEKIVAGKYPDPKNFSKHLRDLVKNLLQVDRSRRFGCLGGGVSDIKDHKFFDGKSWDTILSRKFVPPFVPKLDILDPRNREDFGDFQLKRSSKNLFKEQFKDFSVVRNNA